MWIQVGGWLFRPKFSFTTNKYYLRKDPEVDYGYTIETNFYLPMVTFLSTTGQSSGEFNAENFWEFKWELVEGNVHTPIDNIFCKELI